MQNSLFDFPKVQIDKKIRLITLFSGIGSQEMAMRDIGADFEIHFVCEFDKYAIKSYNAIHGTNFKTSDIRDIHAKDLKITDTDKYCYLMTYSFPNHWQDLNAKDYGIPQNRDRCFCVSILSEEFVDFEFPKPVKLDTVMRDFLEDQVDEKYYIKSEKAEKLIAELIERGELPTEQNRTEQNRTEQNRTDCHLRKTVSITGMANDNPKYQAKCSMTDCASTLLARDYKGPANFAKMNGVIERSPATC